MRKHALDGNSTGPGEELPRIRLFLLGRFRMERNGATVVEGAWQRPKARLLVELLATAPGNSLHRGQLYEELWPELRPDAAANNLRRVLHLARSVLDASHGERPSTLQLTRKSLSLDNAQVWIDAGAFEAAVRRARASRSVEDYEGALSLYGGELLPEQRYEEWACDRREQLEELCIQTRYALVEAYTGQGKLEEAIAALRQVLAQDPTREDGHRMLMRLFARQGNHHLALRQYQICLQILAEQLEVEPDAETNGVYHDIRSGRIANDRLPAKASRSPTTILPPVMRQVPIANLVGRERALSVMMADDIFSESYAVGDQLPAERRAAVFLSGEAGVGKTRLAVELARDVTDRGGLVLWGACHEQEQRLPYGPFIEALDRYGMTLGDEERAGVVATFPEIARLLPSCFPLGQEVADLDPQAERTRLIAAVVGLLSGLASRQPLLLVLDDLHLADSATLQLLLRLILVGPEHRWLVVGTYRAEEVVTGSPLPDVLSTTSRAGASRHIDLLRLGRADSDCLARMLIAPGEPRDELLDYLFGRSLGNPFFLSELIVTMRENGSLTLHDERWRVTPLDGPLDLPVPREIRHLIESRVAAMGTEVAEALKLVAVADGEISLDVLAVAAAETWNAAPSDDALLTILDRALDARILHESAAGYAFRHPLFQEALYQRLSQARRARLHGALGHALEALRPDDVEALAHHYGRSREADRAIRYLEQAGDRATRTYANVIAAAHYRELVVRLEAAGRRTDAGQAREKWARILALLTQYDDALDVLEVAASTYLESADLEAIARVTAAIGRVHALRGTPLNAIERVRSVLATAGDGLKPGTEAGLHLAIAHLSAATGEYPAQVEAAAHAGELSRIADDDYLLAEAEERRGLGLFMLLALDAARVALESAIALAERLNELATLYRALSNVSYVHALLGDVRTGTSYCRRALDVAERLGDPGNILFTLVDLGGYELVLGNVALARELSTRALSALQKEGDGWYQPYVLNTLGWFLHEAGDSRGQVYVDEALVRAEASGDAHSLRLTQCTLAAMDLHEGRASAARARLLPILQELRDHEYGFLYTSVLLARAHLNLGELDAAEALIQRLIVTARTCALPSQLANASVVQAMIFSHRKHWDQARAACDTAIALARSLDVPFFLANILQDCGRVLLETGDHERARTVDAEATAMRARYGSVGLVLESGAVPVLR